MNNKQLKRLKEQIASPFVKVLVSLRVPADFISLLSVFFAVYASWVLIQRGDTVLFAGLAFLSISADALDGSVARAQKKAGLKGRFLDQVLDRYNDAIILVGIILSGFVTLLLGLVALSLSLIASYTSEAGELNLKQRGKKKVTAEGLSLRWIRWLAIVVGGLAGDLQTAVMAVALIALYGSIHRFFVFYRVL